MSGKYFGHDHPFSVYIANKEQHDRGENQGEWLHLPTSSEKLRELLQIMNGDRGGWFIQEVNSHIYGIDTVLEICNDLNELNYLAAKLDDLDEMEFDSFVAVTEIDEHCDSVMELINLADNLDCYNVEAEISDYDDLARYVLYDRDSYSYNRNTLDALEDYIDFEGFGRAVAEGEGGVLADACYVCPSGCSFVENYNGNPATIPEQYRVTQKIIVPELTEDERLEKSIELAISLDTFFREFDRDYAAQHPNVQLQQEALCDNLFAGKIADIDAMLDDLGQGEHDVLPMELAEFKAAIRYDPEKDIPETMTVLVVEPRQAPSVREIPIGEDGLSDTVGGPISATYPFDDMVALICNDEAKFMGAELNRALYDGNGKIYDVVPGTFVIAGLGDGCFTSLPEDLTEKFSRRFQTIEVYAQVGNRTVMFQVPQDTPDISDQCWDQVIADKLNHKPSIRDKLATMKQECAARPSQERNHKRSEPEL